MSDNTVNQAAPGYTMWQLVRYMLGLGTWGFGGPVALVGYMYRDLVEKRGWITESEYKEGLTLAQLMPGPLAAQLAIYLGFVHHRFVGATLRVLSPEFFDSLIRSQSQGSDPFKPRGGTTADPDGRPVPMPTGAKQAEPEFPRQPCLGWQTDFRSACGRWRRLPPTRARKIKRKPPFKRKAQANSGAAPASAASPARDGPDR